MLGTVLILLVALAGFAGYSYVASAPERAEAKVQAGIVLMSPGHYPEARQKFTEALEIDPDSWNAYFHRADAERTLQQHEPALADYQAALRLNPSLLEARTASAAIYRDKGEQKRAIEEITKVIAAKPSVDAYYQRGVTYAEIGMYAEAIRDFSHVIEDVRDAPHVFRARARAKRAMGDEAGALEDDGMARGLEDRQEPGTTNAIF